MFAYPTYNFQTCYPKHTIFFIYFALSVCFVCVDAICPIKLFFSHVWTFPVLKFNLYSSKIW